MQSTWEDTQKQALLANFTPALIRKLAAKHGTPLQIVNTTILLDRYNQLTTALPNVRHHFAVKAFPAAEGLKVLAEAGAGFDLASSGEIDLITPLSVPPQSLIHTHPIKRSEDLSYALERSITTFVFDSHHEFEVLDPYKDRLELLLRVSFRSEAAQIDLSAKFGLPKSEVIEVLKQAKQQGFNVVGLSFHAGSQLSTPEPIVEAIEACRGLFDDAKAAGIELHKLDIGGGFPAPYTEPVPSLEDFCAPIHAALETHFKDAEVISEAGRGIVAEAVISVAQVMGRADRYDEPWYYLDDGVYGSYSGQLFEHGRYHIWSLKELEDPSLTRHPSTIAGPTCDSVDVMVEHHPVPPLKRGDLIVSPAMGAYSWATSVSFNAFPIPKLVFIS